MSKEPIHYECLNRSDWEHLMNAYEAGDDSQRAFCAQRGLALSTFQYWRARLRRLQHNENRDTSLQAVAPLLELSSLPLGNAPPCVHWRVEIELGQGVILRLR